MGPHLQPAHPITSANDSRKNDANGQLAVPFLRGNSGSIATVHLREGSVAALCAVPFRSGQARQSQSVAASIHAYEAPLRSIPRKPGNTSPMTRSAAPKIKRPVTPLGRSAMEKARSPRRKMTRVNPPMKIRCSAASRWTGKNKGQCHPRPGPRQFQTGNKQKGEKPDAAGNPWRHRFEEKTSRQQRTGQASAPFAQAVRLNRWRQHSVQKTGYQGEGKPLIKQCPSHWRISRQRLIHVSDQKQRGAQKRHPPSEPGQDQLRRKRLPPAPRAPSHLQGKNQQQD